MPHVGILFLGDCATRAKCKKCSKSALFGRLDSWKGGGGRTARGCINLLQLGVLDLQPAHAGEEVRMAQGRPGMAVGGMSCACGADQWAKHVCKRCILWI